ncbi:MAG TPA: alkaline phosphatase family protein [Candidatus Binataceae bacterium]|nr:alkaline phosphatase family protein [Candidatus Binataceae bacterium]
MRAIKSLASATGALATIALAAGMAVAGSTPKTPIQHVVVIFQENVSFDHYFATYPIAKNTDGTSFAAMPGTPTVNNLASAGLLTNNPNGSNPFRLSNSQSATCDQDHNYTDEQGMFDLGLMDNFLAYNSGCSPNQGHPNDLIMGYFDGNTVTAIWNYAQHFAMNDNEYGTTFGPSAPGVINLISGNTNGAIDISTSPSAASDVVADGNGGFSVINDAQPAGDTCTSRDNLAMSGKNIGDELNTAGVSWGFFQGGFDLTITNPNGTTGCHRTHTSATGEFPAKVDYIPHHQGFQYYSSTANPTHVRPTSSSTVGQASDPGNHQYDIHDFFDAVKAGNFPAVSFLKASGYQDGHAGYSSPLDEQTFLAETINFLMTQKEWANTLIIINWDDSDGWYDHQMSPIVSQSNTSADVGTKGVNDGKALCGSTNTNNIGGRCGYGPRIPYLVISPYAKPNFVDHTIIDQSSTIRFIEDNWSLPRIANSFDAIAGSIDNMLDFSAKKVDAKKRELCVAPDTGAVTKCTKSETPPSN